MVIEVKGQPVANFVLLEAVEIETQNPDVQDVDGNSPVGRKIPGKNRVVLNAETHIDNDEDKDPKNDKTGPNSNPHVKILPLRTFIFMSCISQILPCIFTLHLFVLFDVQILDLLDIGLFDSGHSVYFVVTGVGGWNQLFCIFFVLFKNFSFGFKICLSHFCQVADLYICVLHVGQKKLVLLPLSSSIGNPNDNLIPVLNFKNFHLVKKLNNLHINLEQMIKLSVYSFQTDPQFFSEAFEFLLVPGEESFVIEMGMVMGVDDEEG